MAERPVFIPAPNEPGFVRVLNFSLAWHAGFAASQKKKNVVALHQAAAKAGYSPLLEVSTKSDEALGRRLSAFHLRVQMASGTPILLECAFQGSKVFQNGGPYTDLFALDDPRLAKRDERLKTSGPLVRFEFQGQRFPLEPKTFFYDWLYINAIFNHRDWLQRESPFLRYAGFTDIEFNPGKSINCQARSCGLFAALIQTDLLEEATSSPDAFLAIITRTTPEPQSGESAGQMPLMDGEAVDEPSRSTPAAYLHSSELAQLERFGVTATSTSLTFTKPLDEAQLRRVWHIVAAIQRRRPKSEDWVNWLIGDFGIKAAAHLGEGAFERIVHEETRAYVTGQHLLLTAGGTLLALQIAERAFAVCCHLLEPHNPQDVALFSQDTGARTRTLGQLNRALQKWGIFAPDFDQRLDAFVKHRNRFAHNLLAENADLPTRSHPDRMAGFELLETSVLSLLREATEVTVILFGLFTAMGVGAAERANIANIEAFLDEHAAPDWRESLAKFVSVKRAP